MSSGRSSQRFRSLLLVVFACLGLALESTAGQPTAIATLLSEKSSKKEKLAAIATLEREYPQGLSSDLVTELSHYLQFQVSSFKGYDTELRYALARLLALEAHERPELREAIVEVALEWHLRPKVAEGPEGGLEYGVADLALAFQEAREAPSLERMLLDGLRAKNSGLLDRMLKNWARRQTLRVLKGNAPAHPAERELLASYVSLALLVFPDDAQISAAAHRRAAGILIDDPSGDMWPHAELLNDERFWNDLTPATRARSFNAVAGAILEGKNLADGWLWLEVLSHSPWPLARSSGELMRKLLKDPQFIELTQEIWPRAAKEFVPPADLALLPIASGRVDQVAPELRWQVASELKTRFDRGPTTAAELSFLTLSLHSWLALGCPYAESVVPKLAELYVVGETSWLKPEVDDPLRETPLVFHYQEALLRALDEGAQRAPLSPDSLVRIASAPSFPGRAVFSRFSFLSRLSLSEELFAFYLEKLRRWSTQSRDNTYLHDSILLALESQRAQLKDKQLEKLALYLKLYPGEVESFAVNAPRLALKLKPEAVSARQDLDSLARLRYANLAQFETDHESSELEARIAEARQLISRVYEDIVSRLANRWNDGQLSDGDRARIAETLGYALAGPKQRLKFPVKAQIKLALGLGSSSPSHRVATAKLLELVRPSAPKVLRLMRELAQTGEVLRVLRSYAPRTLQALLETDHHLQSRCEEFLCETGVAPLAKPLLRLVPKN